jgi:type IV pilus assembly protein PilC
MSPNQVQRQDRAIKKLRRAMIYPAVILTLALGVCTVLIVVVLPNFVPLFNEFKASLPLPTRILFAIVAFSAAYRIEIVAVIALILVAGFFFFQSKPGKVLWDYTITRLPVIVPALIIAEGAAVGFVAVSVIMPMYGLLQSVR